MDTTGQHLSDLQHRLLQKMRRVAPLALDRHEALYRFLRYSSAGEKATVSDALVHRRFRFGRPKDFNDPFDCRPHFRLRRPFRWLGRLRYRRASLRLVRERFPNDLAKEKLARCGPRHRFRRAIGQDQTETPDERAKREARYHVLFGARESVRYHDRRVAHFEWLHRLTDLLTILLAGIVAMELLGAEEKAPPVKWFTKIVAGLAALLSAFDLLVGFARSADLHRSLKRRFIDLEKKCVDEFDANQMSRERLTIEADEPPIYRALQLLCTRELAIAQDIKPADYPAGYVPLPWYMRLTANWLHWPNAANVIPNQKRKGFWRWLLRR